MQLTLTADPDSGLADAQLDPLAADVRKRIGEGASEFLRLRSSRPTDTKACGGRTVPGFNGRPMNAGPYSGLVRVTAVNITRQPASSLTRQTVSQHGAGVDTLVSYEQYDEDLTGTISGWVTVTDQRAGGMSVPLPVRVTAQATARWQRSPVSTVTRQDPFTRQTTTAVMVDASGGRARAEEERRRARGVLSEKLLAGFAEETARLLLSTVDVEPAVPDRSELPDIVSQ